MSSDLTRAIAEFNAALDECARLDLNGLTAAELREVLERIQSIEIEVVNHQRELIAQLSRAPADELSGELPDVLADRLHISRGEAVHRIIEAQIWAEMSCSRVRHSR